MKQNQRIPSQNIANTRQRTGAVLFLILWVLLATVLALFSNRFASLNGWSGFLWVSLLSAGILLGVWRLMRYERPPTWLFYLIIGAAILRLVVGVLWTVALPIWGHATPAEQAGYVMGDAAGRDQAAWKLAQSKASLLTSFRNNRKVDQYGGLLFISAWIYRYLGGNVHQPLLIVLLGSTFSALAVLFVWAFTRRFWGEFAAMIAAWILFIYPEAVLLGSSQMREAFTIPLAIAAFYGLARYREDRSAVSLAWALAPFFITIFFSPLSAAMLLGCLILVSFFLLDSKDSRIVQRRWFWFFLCLLAVVGLAGLWVALREVVPARITNPIAMVSWWLRKSASFQAYLSEHASGWMQKIFKLTPEWTHLPMLLIYGIVQPFLPAALVAGSQAPIWRLIAVWRSIGWTFLLALIAYAPFYVFRRNGNHNLERVITLAVWLIVLVAAFRGGGDMWDNPRYRSIFSGLQIALAAHILLKAVQTRDRWLWRALLLVGAIVIWFLPWYFQRYYSIGWPVTDPFLTLALGLTTGLLLIIADWAKTRRRKPPRPMP